MCDGAERAEPAARIVKRVQRGAVVAEVTVDVGGQEITSVITNGSVDRLKLAPGDRVVAIVKATEVMIGK